jgi:hypothetical protein
MKTCALLLLCVCIITPTAESKGSISHIRRVCASCAEGSHKQIKRHAGLSRGPRRTPQQEKQVELALAM